MTTAYTTGTITLTNGSTAITGTGTGWATALIAGGTIYPDVAGGNALPIASVNSDTAITAAIAWRGATGTYSYALMRDTAYGEQTVANAQALAAYIARLDSKSLAALASLAGDMSANKLAYASGATTMAWTEFAPYARELLEKENGGDFYAGLGVVPEAQVPERLRDVAKVIGDWNDADHNGWYMADGAANAPSAGWLIGWTQAHNGLYCVQFVTGFTADVAANSYTWRRLKVGGSWAPWRRVYQTEGEVMPRTGGTFTGSIQVSGAGGAYVSLDYVKDGIVRATSGIDDSADCNYFVDLRNVAGGWVGRPFWISGVDLRTYMARGFNITTAENLTRGIISGYGPGQGYGLSMTSGVPASSGVSEPLTIFNSGASYVGGIRTDDTQTFFVTSSDYRLKEQVAPLVTDFALSSDGFDALDEAHLRVMAARPVSYYWSDHPELGRQTGFIAHELQVVAPHAVTGEKDGEEDIGTATIAEQTVPATEDEPERIIPAKVFADVRDGEIPGAEWVKTGSRPVYQGVDHAKLVPDLVAAVQRLTVLTLEQADTIAALSARLDAIDAGA